MTEFFRAQDQVREPIISEYLVRKANRQEVHKIQGENQVLKIYYKAPPLFVLWEEEGSLLPMSFVEFATEILKALEEAGAVAMPDQWSVLDDIQYKGNLAAGFTQTYYPYHLETSTPARDQLPFMDTELQGHDHVFADVYESEEAEEPSRKSVFIDWDGFLDVACKRMNSDADRQFERGDITYENLGRVCAEIRAWGKGRRKE